MFQNFFNRKVEDMALVVRASIVLGMSAAVVTLIYLAPAPDQNFKSCDRPCHSLDWPMICRVKMHVESLPINVICQDCLDNSTNCRHPYCTDPTSTQSVILANGYLPANPIQVCKDDILVIDVVNKIPGHAFTMHWRGQPNHEAPFMDGVPFVTQCPIIGYQSFQYKFRASTPGTHLFHAYSDEDRAKGLFGALVVREADRADPNSKLYDLDLKEHVLVISQWGDSLLVDGTTSKVITVKKGSRYRFRTAYATGNCPVTYSIDDHVFKVISLDGQPINPYEASSVTLAKGERVDFVLKTNREIGSYALRVESTCNSEITGQALITYNGASTLEKSADKIEPERNGRTLDTSFCDRRPGMVCLESIKSLERIPKALQGESVDRKLYLGYDFRYASSQGPLENIKSKSYRMDNITFVYPSAPLLTQPDDVPQELMCNSFGMPEYCKEKEICECVHIEHLPLGSSTEIILFDKGSDQDEHVFHLHGHQFYVVGYRVFDGPLSKDEVKSMDVKNELMDRNLATPALKDTVRIPKNAAVAIRFIANNSGFWMLRDELSKGWTRGLDVVLQVGGLVNIVTTPTGFPTCTSFTGPDFFMM